MKGVRKGNGPLISWTDGIWPVDWQSSKDVLPHLCIMVLCGGVTSLVNCASLEYRKQKSPILCFITTFICTFGIK